MFDFVVFFVFGGYIVYVGEIGENVEIVVKYFGDCGVYCFFEVNFVEFILGM